MAGAQPQPRSFSVNPASDAGEPLCIGLGGPPGGGKTWSALRLADGFSRVRGGKPALIDTEAGRARKYHVDRMQGGFDFDYIPFSPPFIPAHFMDAINEAAKLNPSAIIIDNATDEHEGPGGVLEWHDRDVPAFKGNEWAAWNAPKKSRRILTTGIQQIKIPIILTFRARPKTKQVGKQIQQLGYVPIAGEELLGIMDVFCLLPPRSNGVAIWSSQKAGEDFAIKVPRYLARYIEQGAPISEDLGEAFGRWQLGKSAPAQTDQPRRRTPEEQVDAYVKAINDLPTLDALREYQMDEPVVAWAQKMRDLDGALHDRIVNANSRRANELAPAEIVTDDDTQEEED